MSTPRSQAPPPSLPAMGPSISVPFRRRNHKGPITAEPPNHNTHPPRQHAAHHRQPCSRQAAAAAAADAVASKYLLAKTLCDVGAGRELGSPVLERRPEGQAPQHRNEVTAGNHRVTDYAAPLPHPSGKVLACSRGSLAQPHSTQSRARAARRHSRSKGGCATPLY